MPGNNRVFYGCLGIGQCGSGPMSGIISAKYSLNREINHIFAPGKTNPIATYGAMPNIEISYTQYLSSFTSLASENGLNNFTGFDMMVGSDSSTSNPNLNKTIRGSFMLLNSITYNLGINSPFTVEKSYSGYSKPAGGPGGTLPASTANVLRRQSFNGTLPSQIAETSPQNISASFKINRDFIGEFGTRKPYASYIRFPIESSCTFEVLTKELDQYVIDAMQSACQNPQTYSQDIVLSLCGNLGSITIKKAYLTSLSYSGGDAGSNDNQTLSVTYTGYASPDNITPVLILPDEDPCG